MDIDRVEYIRERIYLISPKGLVERFAREYSSLIAPEEFDDVVLLGGEFDRISISRYLPSIPIEGNTSDLWWCSLLTFSWSTPPHDVLYTEPEFLEVKWLHEIVIRSEGESFDLIDLFGECGQEEKWYIDGSSLYHPHEGESIDLRYHTVDDEKIIVGRADHIESLLSVVSDICMVSLRSEIERDILTDGLIIFDDEDFLHTREYTDPILRAN